ncbi:hypothetical protein FBZ87_11357 [Nitrospirillum amazonense]|uniref:Uncharacterized protein n=1 Tax=Nitrospirillum amazonense TaxID=28077 RepID=A0A560JEQ4_9PROT|nr:hypothetical protein [Nitrospirillum amazonense]TWB67814.1 hypothetical protein FBZ87_11357 [Nitrospirillum amazonense]
MASFKLPVYGNSNILTYLATHRKDIEVISDNEVRTRPHVAFLHVNMLTAIRSSQTGYAFEDILREYKEKIADNSNYYILIDYSHEGAAFNEVFSSSIIEMHNLLIEYNIDESKVSLAQHNILFGNESSGYLRWCRRHGRRPFNLHLVHWWMLDQSAMLHKKYSDSHILNQHIDNLTAAIFSDNPKPKRFLCFNYFPRPHRVLLLLWMIERNILNKGLVSFPGFRIPEVPHIDFFEESKYYCSNIGLGQRLSKHLDQLARLSPLIADTDGVSNKSSLQDRFVQEPYLITDFSIITETDFSNGLDSRRVTEKFLKSASNMHPFLIAGEPGSLSSLREHGFVTFEPFFDETYDTFADPETRIERLFANVSNKCSATPYEVSQSIRSMYPILLRNMEYVASDFWGHNREKYETPLVEYLQRKFLGLYETMTDKIRERPYCESIEIPSDDVTVFSIGSTLDLNDIRPLKNFRGYVVLSDTLDPGNHCCVFRINRGLDSKIILRIDIKSAGAKSIMIDIKHPRRAGVRLMFNFDIGVITSVDQLSYGAQLSVDIQDQGDGWFQLGAECYLGGRNDPFDIVFYLGNPHVTFDGTGTNSVLLSSMSLILQRPANSTVS